MAPVVAAKFQRWTEVRTIPDSSPGLHPSHAETVFGRVVDCQEGDGIWEYRIQATDDGRQVTSWIPEHRVVALSKAVFEDRLVTRATAADPSLTTKRQLEAAVGTIVKQKRKIKRLKERASLVEEELVETKALRKEIKRLEKSVNTQKDNNRILLSTARDRQVENIQQVFSRTGPPASASKVTQQLRELFMGKISEKRSRTSEVEELMGGLADKIATLSASLRLEIRTGLATRKALREAKRDSKVLKKVVDVADAAAVLDGVRDKFKRPCAEGNLY